MRSTARTEREVKLKTGQAFRLPHFPGEPLPPRLFTSTYFDTVDFRLARLGVTLRRRTERKRVVWQLKLQDKTPGWNWR